jgi:hypothetical protein
MHLNNKWMQKPNHKLRIINHNVKNVIEKKTKTNIVLCNFILILKTKGKIFHLFVCYFIIFLNE